MLYICISELSIWSMKWTNAECPSSFTLGVRKVRPGSASQSESAVTTGIRIVVFAESAKETYKQLSSQEHQHLLLNVLHPASHKLTCRCVGELFQQ